MLTCVVGLYILLTKVEVGIDIATHGENVTENDPCDKSKEARLNGH